MYFYHLREMRQSGFFFNHKSTIYLAPLALSTTVI